MHRFRRNRQLNRLVALAIALFISNIVVVSCAMAYTFCNDCPEHVPALCADPCATTEVTIADKTGDAKPDAHRPVVHAYTVLPLDSVLKPGQTTVAQPDWDRHDPSPPLYVRFCAFLI